MVKFATDIRVVVMAVVAIGGPITCRSFRNLDEATRVAAEANPVVAVGDTRIDLNLLKDKYPLGFQVCRANTPETTVIIPEQAEVAWKCKVSWDRIPTNQLNVFLRVEYIYFPRISAGVENITFSNTVENKAGAVCVLTPVKSKTRDIPAAYFELLDNDDVHPLFVIGFAFRKE